MTSTVIRMRGKVLSSLVENGELRLPKGVQVDDLEVMLGLLLSARGISQQDQLTDLEEKFALWSLCRWAIPLKPSKYAHDASALLSHFRGISGSAALQGKFKARISRRFIEADARQALSEEGIGITRVYEVLRRVRSQAIRVRAQAYRAEFLLAA